MDCEAEGVSSVYDLFGVVNHFGSLNGGHYTAYCQNPDGKWYDFNDSSVSSHSPSNVCTSAAYILFYRRRPMEKKERVPKSEESKSTLNTSGPSSQKNGQSVDKEEEYIYQLD
jgi:hypothetical protein